MNAMWSPEPVTASLSAAAECVPRSMESRSAATAATIGVAIEVPLWVR